MGVSETRKKYFGSNLFQTSTWKCSNQQNINIACMEVKYPGYIIGLHIFYNKAITKITANIMHLFKCQHFLDHIREIDIFHTINKSLDYCQIPYDMNMNL